MEPRTLLHRTREREFPNGDSSEIQPGQSSLYIQARKSLSSSSNNVPSKPGNAHSNNKNSLIEENSRTNYSIKNGPNYATKSTAFVKQTDQGRKFASSLSVDILPSDEVASHYYIVTEPPNTERFGGSVTSIKAQTERVMQSTSATRSAVAPSSIALNADRRPMNGAVNEKAIEAEPLFEALDRYQSRISTISGSRKLPTQPQLQRPTYERRYSLTSGKVAARMELFENLAAVNQSNQANQMNLMSRSSSSSKLSAWSSRLSISAASPTDRNGGSLALWNRSNSNDVKAAANDKLEKETDRATDRTNWQPERSAAPSAPLAAASSRRNAGERSSHWEKQPDVQTDQAANGTSTKSVPPTQITPNSNAHQLAKQTSINLEPRQRPLETQSSTDQSDTLKLTSTKRLSVNERRRFFDTVAGEQTTEARAKSIPERPLQSSRPYASQRSSIMLTDNTLPTKRDTRIHEGHSDNESIDSLIAQLEANRKQDPLENHSSSNQAEATSQLNRRSLLSISKHLIPEHGKEEEIRHWNVKEVDEAASTKRPLVGPFVADRNSDLMNFDDQRSASQLSMSQASTSSIHESSADTGRGSSSSGSVSQSLSKPVDISGAEPISTEEDERSLALGKHTIDDPMAEVLLVSISRPDGISSGGIGVVLTGGADCENKSIQVNRVISHSLAHKDGRVKVGDRILVINGQSTQTMTHRQAVEALKCPRKTVTLVLSRLKYE